MPRALKVVVSCDNCMNDIENEEHEGALTLTINGSGPKQIDLCQACLKGDDFDEFNVRGLLRLFEQAEVIPQAAPVRRGPARNTNQSNPSPCPVPGCDHVAGSPQGLGRHTRTAHGATVSELRDPAVMMEVSRRET